MSLNVTTLRQPDGLPGLSDGNTSHHTSSRGPGAQDEQLIEALATIVAVLAGNATGQASQSAAAGNGQPGAGTQRSGGAQPDDPLSRTRDALGQNGQQDIAKLLLMALVALLQNGQKSQNGNGASPLDNGQGAGGAQGANPQHLGRSLLQDSGDGALDNSLSPTGDGGGRINDNELVIAILTLLARLMDNQQGRFGQPQDGSGNNGAGSANPVDASLRGAAPSSSGSPLASTLATDDAKDGAPTSSVAFPTADNANAVVVDKPIKVGKGEVFDGEGKTFVASSKLGAGDQKEGQKPLFDVADGGTVKNVIFGDNAADGIHLRGDATIDNVHWTNVGEDALTVKSNTDGKKSTVNITNSSAQGASDKVFQLNANTNFNVDNFRVKDFGTFVRTNGGKQGDWSVNLNHIQADNGKFSMVKSNDKDLDLKVSNSTLNNVKHPFDKIPDTANVQLTNVKVN